MIKEDYCDEELSGLLEKIGFKDFSSKSLVGPYNICTLSLAQKWLREEKHIQISTLAIYTNLPSLIIYAADATDDKGFIRLRVKTLSYAETLLGLLKKVCMNIITKQETK